MQIPLPSFMTLKSASVKKKRTSDAQVDGNPKRFRKGRRRDLFLLDQDEQNDGDQDELQEDDGEVVQ